MTKPKSDVPVSQFSVRNQVEYFQRCIFTAEIWGKSPEQIPLYAIFGSTLNLIWFQIHTGFMWFLSATHFGITYKAANPFALFSCSWYTSQAALQCWNNPWRTHLFIKALESLSEKCLLLIFSPLLCLALALLDAYDVLRKPAVLVMYVHNQDSLNVVTLLVRLVARSQHITKKANHF